LLACACWRITFPFSSDIAEFPNCPEHLKKEGLRVGRDFTLKFNQKRYFKARIVLAYIRTILLPYIDTFRGLAVFAQEIAVFLMAHSSANVSDDVIHILTEARVDSELSVRYRSFDSCSPVWHLEPPLSISSDFSGKEIRICFSNRSKSSAKRFGMNIP
jgi:hypothetical protein